jgi:hypothetical protein
MDSLEMLKTEEGQLNAVFACFGSAAQHSQFFEVALGDFLLAYNRLCNTSLTVADLDVLGAKLERQTMGTLLRQLRTHVTIGDEKITQLMHEALQQRNFLMHHYFRQRSGDFRSEDGRISMLRELVSIGNQLEQAIDIANGMRVALERAMAGDVSTGPQSEVVFSMEVKVEGPEGDDAA